MESGVREQADLAGKNVTALVRLCGRVFALRRVDGVLQVRQVRPTPCDADEALDELEG